MGGLVTSDTRVTIKAPMADTVCYTLDGETMPQCSHAIGMCSVGKTLVPGMLTVPMKGPTTQLNSIACKAGQVASSPMPVQVYSMLPPPIPMRS